MSGALSRRAVVLGGVAWLLTARRAAAGGVAVGRIETDEPVVALTFDDGPDPEYTPEVLDTLARFGAGATFFVVGVNALASPDLVRRQLSEGHGVANHTYDHPRLERLDVARVRAQIDDGAAVLRGLGVPPPILFRPPRGSLGGPVRALAQEAGQRPVMWDLCLEHFVRHHGVAAGTDRLLERVGRGSIILAHDGGRVVARDQSVVDRRGSVAALPRLIDGLHRRGLRPLPVGSLLPLGAGVRGTD